MHDIALGIETGGEERVRLHITPFNPGLLDKIIPPSIQPSAHNISFHAVQTFPDRGFGYIDLPIMEAQKIKKKLNGSTLRGTKLRIEEAKPERKRKSDANNDEDVGRKARRTERKEKKRREEGVIPGHELDEGRRVKRGWADEKESSSKTSKRKDRTIKRIDEADNSLDGKKLRFKTVVPPNTAPIVEKHTERAKRTKSKEGTKSANKTVVEEFSNSRTLVPGAKQGLEVNQSSLSYVDGQGWVNDSGEVVEAVSESRSRTLKTSLPEGEQRVSAIESREVDDLPTATPPEPSTKDIEDDGISIEATAAADSAVETETTQEVHPLEALFKRPANKSSANAKPRPQPIDTSFSFFDPSAAEDAHVGINMPPQTPHTKRDLEWRSIRSAAPTPDTAAIGRKFSFPFADSSEDEEDDEPHEGGYDDDSADIDVDMADADRPKETVASGSALEQGEESAFRKWFYENRGDLNRGWKKRRRDEKKAERQRENRRLSRKVA